MYNKFKEIRPEIIKEKIKTLKNKSIRGMLRELGCDDNNGNEVSLASRFLKENNIEFQRRPTYRNMTVTQDDINSVTNYRDFALMIGLISNKSEYMNSSIYRAIRTIIAKNSLDVSHMSRRTKYSANTYTDEEVFCENSLVSPSTLKKRYIKQCKEIKCNRCGIYSWMGKPLTLQLDHIDGDSTNNILSNLRLLCPNCHSQTDTFCSRKRK